MVQIGLSMVSRVGSKALNLTSVARQAGVARATAYRMFGGRDALVAAIVEHEIAQLRVKLKQWADTETDAAGKVRAQTLGVLGYLREHRALQYVLRNEPEEVARTLVATENIAGRNLIAQVLDQTMPDLEPDIADQLQPNPRAAAEFMVRVVYSVMLIPDGSMSDEQIADLVVRAIVK